MIRKFLSFSLFSIFLASILFAVGGHHKSLYINSFEKNKHYSIANHSKKHTPGKDSKKHKLNHKHKSLPKNKKEKNQKNKPKPVKNKISQ